MRMKFAGSVRNSERFRGRLLLVYALIVYIQNVFESFEWDAANVGDIPRHAVTLLLRGQGSSGSLALFLVLVFTIRRGEEEICRAN